jgi:nucleoside phosphorylase
MQHSDIVILTALPLEFEAVREHLADVHAVVHPRGTQYEIGEFQAAGSVVRIAVVQTGAGNAGTAVECERAIGYFEPRTVLFVGIAGGLKDVSIGDVVIGNKVYAYHSGKALDSFHPRPDVSTSSYSLVQLASAVGRAACWQRRISVAPRQMPRARIAPIAAGEEVVASINSETYGFLKSNYGDACAVEMEGAGFLRAAYANENVRKVVIRGISDLVDKKEVADATGSQPIAAAHAAAFAFELLAADERVSVNEQSEAPTAHDPAFWAELERMAAELYPLGPRDSEIWRRAGGDLAALELGSSGRASWHSALRTLRLGGGGPGITLSRLFSEINSDFPNHEQLKRLKHLK